jgi:hypothetical protein
MVGQMQQTPAQQPTYRRQRLVSRWRVSLIQLPASQDGTREEISLRKSRYTQFHGFAQRTEGGVAGGSEARWNKSGKEIFFIGPGARMMAASVRFSPDNSAIDVATPVELFATEIVRLGTEPSAR